MSSISASLSSLVNNASPSSLPQTQQSAAQYKTEFLQLLLTQLQNQDPTNPVDSTQMVAQQAQIASLEQMQNLNTNFVTLMAMQSVSQSTNLIGHSVTATDSTGASLSGQVVGIKFANGVSTLQVQSGPSTVSDVNLADVTQVSL